MSSAVEEVNGLSPAAHLYHLPLGDMFLSPGDGFTEILLTRHGQQDFGAEAPLSVESWTDPPLSALGERQAAVVADALAAEPIDAVYSSDLRRAHDTGVAIAQRHRLDPIVLPELKEIGLYRDAPAGQRISDIISETVIRGSRAHFVRDRTWDSYPLTETSREFRARLIGAIEGIIVTNPGRRVVVACHGGVINAYIAWVLGLSQDMFFRPGHASISRVRAVDQRRALVSLNEQSYLRAADPALVTA